LSWFKVQRTAQFGETAAKPSERRAHERLAVQCRCLIRIPGVARRIEAWTDNISRGGTLLRFAARSKREAPKIGDVIQVEIPLRETRTCEQRYLDSEGEVVRVLWDAESGSVVMALRLRNMRIAPQPAGDKR